MSRQDFLFGKNKDIRCLYFCAYTDCLRRTGRISDARLIIDMFVAIARQRAGMPSAGLGDGAELVPGIGPVAKATFTHTLALLIEDEEGLTEAVRMLDDTYEIAEYEQLRFDKLFFNGREGARSVCEYARMLIEAERTFDATRVLSSVLFPIREDGQQLFRESDVVNSLKLIGLWLQVQGYELQPMSGDQRSSLVGDLVEAVRKDSRDSHLHPLVVCAQAIVYVRRAFESRTLSLIDLRHLVFETDVFRRHVVQVTFYWAEFEEQAGRSEHSRIIKQWAIVWDLELRQRLLFQRLRLLGYDSTVPPSDKHILPTDRPYLIDLNSSLVKSLVNEVAGHGRRDHQRLPVAMDGSESVVETLQRTTSRLLAAFSALVDLTPISSHLSPDKTHIVISTDGVLNGIPWSCVLVDGEHLCFRVASIRCSMSPLIDRLHLELNQASTTQLGVKERVLVVSSFRENDPETVRKQQAEGHSVNPAALLALILHVGHKAACGDAFRYEAAAEQPRASVEWLIRELQREPIKVLTVLAHGNKEGSISFADGKWFGNGPLENVEWLLLASCSTGQLIGELDVEGLCAELTANGARATLAPKWDVHAADSPAFLNVVLENYLQLCEKADSTMPKRAVALNRARRHFLSRPEPDNNRSAYQGFLPTGINTVAAFELFGVG